MDLSKVQIEWKKHEPELLLEILFSESSGLFQGHFPDFPLLPGVIQIDLVISLVQRHLNPSFSFKGFKNVKFFRPIFPETKVQLRVQLDIESGRIHFEYFKENSPYSKGTILLKQGEV